LQDPALPTELADRADAADEREVQRILVRIFRDKVTISVDASGELLHRRGYRQAVGKAPLRETLAAAMLRASEWSADQPLIDPFCGSGTLCIEGAMIARNIPPGRHRTFSFERWPEVSAANVAAARARGEEGISRAVLPPIWGSDRDAGAIRAAQENADRAGVAQDILFERKAISEVKAPSGSPGTLLTNPPYGVRVGEERGLRDLYQRFADVLRNEFGGWRIGLLVPPRGLIEGLRIGHEWSLDTSNGGIRVGLAVATLHTRGRAANGR
jgi:putative N6-adenine-specific DNA methylase